MADRNDLIVYEALELRSEYDGRLQTLRACLPESRTAGGGRASEYPWSSRTKRQRNLWETGPLIGIETPAMVPVHQSGTAPHGSARRVPDNRPPWPRVSLFLNRPGSPEDSAAGPPSRCTNWLIDRREWRT